MRAPWRPRLGDVVVRRRRPQELEPVTVRLPRARPPAPNVASPLTVAYGFLALIVVGAGLLMLPQANTAHQVPSFTTALFTATSAVTVTGLTVVDTAAYWSVTGQSIIMVLILAGGLGWMTVAGFILVLLGQRVTLPQRMALRQPLGVQNVGGIVRLLRTMVITFLALQALGGGFLGLRLHQTTEWSWAESMRQGVFHSIAGFNNAGFSIVPNSDNLTALRGDMVFLGILAVSIMLGGLSFFVLDDVVRLRRFSRFSLDTKIVLMGSAALWLLGAVVFFAFEAGNSQTLGEMPLGRGLFTAVFHSISARTAGFSTVDFAAVSAATSFFFMGLMLVGTASASTGGGIRLNTLGVIGATVLASIRGQDRVSLFRREIPPLQVHRAITVAWLFLTFVFLAAFFLTFTEKKDFIDLFFETVSAVGTVGLSKGVTPELSVSGQFVIMITMLVGRLGPLALGLALGQREQRPALYHYATEHVKIG